MPVRLMAVACAVFLSGCGDSKQECTPECADGETRCIDAKNFQLCERPPDDPCAAHWGEQIPCPEEEFCVADTGQCQGCTPSCDQKECGPDGCQGTCPPGCEWPEVCNTDLGRCE